MYDSFVLTVVGPDRRGLVESLSETIAAEHGNWVESRMATVGGQFAGLVWLTVPTEHAASLEKALQGLANDRLHIVVQRAERSTPQPARTLRLEFVGHDRPGIVRDLARELSRRNINVEELTSDSYSAPMTGELLFKANVELGVPDDANMNELYQALEELREHLHLDLTYDEPQSAT
ncbi:glycine cleavage system protein R [Phycisphaerales bacterium AB-hyl4]|uniref:Glycine cleavage system protein R n=1 Tax=Natronomicrosphaera hydrolytica TaxID=3242702 RepID=A0ABV4U4M3_9BACT